MGTDFMSNTTDFDSLKSKYNGFTDPVVSLSIISKSQKDKFVITDVTVEITSGFSAGIAIINVFNVYDDKKRNFKDSEFSQIFQIGKKIIVEMGYLKTTECVFCGFISGISYVLSSNGLPHIVLECLDVKAIMMSNNNNMQLKQDTYSASISEIVQKSSYKSYYKTADIDSNVYSAKGDNKPLIEMTDESDYDFIVRVAKKYGYEFFVSQETLYLRKRRIKKEPIMKISHKNIIIEIESNYNVMGMVKSVEVRSLDDNTGNLITAKATSDATYGSSSSASKITQNSSKVIIDPTVISNSDAQNRADAKLDEILWKFGLIKIKTIGIPELIPGRFIKIEGISEDVNKKVYITKVIHTLGSEGFQTFLEARIDRL